MKFDVTQENDLCVKTGISQSTILFQTICFISIYI